MSRSFRNAIVLKMEFEKTPLVGEKDIFETFKSNLAQVQGGAFDILQLKRKGLMGDLEVMTLDRPNLIQVTIPLNLNFKKIALLCSYIERIERISAFTVKISFSDLIDYVKIQEEKVMERAGDIEKIILSKKDFPTENNWESFIKKVGQFQCGADFESEDEVYLVEGYYDGKAMILADYRNFLILGGVDFNLESLKATVGNKIVTLFLDMDQIGQKLTQYLISSIEVDFVAFGPEGVSVEDLKPRVIQKFLQKRVPLQVYKRNIQRVQEEYVHINPSISDYSPLLDLCRELGPNEFSLLSSSGEQLIKENILSFEGPSESFPESTFVFYGTLNKSILSIARAMGSSRLVVKAVVKSLKPTKEIFLFPLEAA